MEATTEINNRLLQLKEETVHCPSCDVALKPYEVMKHCEEEIEELKQMQNKVCAGHQAAGTHMQNGESKSTPWSIFRKVQKNRQARMKLRSRKRSQPERVCPVCNLSFAQDEIQRHAEQCLRQNNFGENDDDASEDDGEYEEYEWAGQKRIRVSSLLQGGYGSLGLSTVVTKTTVDDDDEDLNVDEDDTQIYGPAQYDESDVIPSTMDVNGSDPEGHSVATYMRQLIAGGCPATGQNQPALKMERTSFTPGTNDESLNQETAMELKYTPNSIDYKNAECPSMQKNQLQVIESLKAKLRHYENHIQTKFKCLICLDDYRNPAISVSCWHVHCEDCWLRSLGARKLCPQCNLITSPKDLRRIYL